MNKNTVISIDLAKNVFQICILDKHGKQKTNKRLSRAKLLAYIAQQSPATIAMEACYSSHYWAREFTALGHTARLIPAQHVKPFVRGNKNDANDALAIAEAAFRPNIRPVPIKSIYQQDIQSYHRIRERLIGSRTALSNQTRGLLSEYGVVMNQGYACFTKTLAELIDEADSRLTSEMKAMLIELREEFNQVTQRLKNIDQRIRQFSQDDDRAANLLTVPGIGPVISTALISAIGNGSQFKSSKEFSAWLGVTPKQFSSGESSYNAGITKRGNRYLRKQLIHGARAALRWCRKRDDRLSQWANEIVARRGIHKGAVAMAHKMARMAWSMLVNNQSFKLAH